MNRQYLVFYTALISLFLISVLMLKYRIDNQKNKLSDIKQTLEEPPFEQEKEKLNATWPDQENSLQKKLGTSARKGVVLKGDVAFDVYTVDFVQSELRFYHKNDKGVEIKKIENLIKYLDGDTRRLVFATNGGIFESNLKPTGLYVEEGKEIYPLNFKKSTGNFSNFYSLPPNGVFFIKENNRAGIMSREDFNKRSEKVKYATQSGPMLVVADEINPKFKKDSANKYIRSGVGVTVAGEVVFAISEKPVNFYDFSRIFKYYGCRNALYLDGAISEMYIPEIGRIKTENEFSLLLAVIDKK